MQQLLLQRDIIADTTEYLNIKDLVSFEQSCSSIRSTIVDRNVWRRRFRHIWSAFNFILDPNVPLQLDASLVSYYKTESAAYASLIPAIQLTPQDIDLEVAEADGRRPLQSPAAEESRRRFQAFKDAATPSCTTADSNTSTTRLGFTGPLGDGQSVRTTQPSNMSQDSVIVHRSAFATDGRQVYHVTCKRAFYFEIVIESETTIETRKRRTDTDSISIGFGLNSFKMAAKPGMDSKSVGYHGDSGKKHLSSVEGEAYADPFGPGDTVGCGCYFYNRSKASECCGAVFYTKNGLNLGLAYTFRIVGQSPEYILAYPVIYFDSFSIVSVNFGRRPFKYNGYSANVKESCLECDCQKCSRANEEDLPPVLPHWTCNSERQMMQKFQNLQKLWRTVKMSHATNES